MLWIQLCVDKAKLFEPLTIRYYPLSDTYMDGKTLLAFCFPDVKLQTFPSVIEFVLTDSYGKQSFVSARIEPQDHRFNINMLMSEYPLMQTMRSALDECDKLSQFVDDFQVQGEVADFEQEQLVKRLSAPVLVRSILVSLLLDKSLILTTTVSITYMTRLSVTISSLLLAKYNYPMIPLLPKMLHDTMHSPTPFFVGVYGGQVSDMDKNVVQFDLDSLKTVHQMSIEVPYYDWLVSELELAMYGASYQQMDNIKSSVEHSPSSVQDIITQWYHKLLKNVPQCFIISRTTVKFDLEKFISLSSKQCGEFYKQLSRSSMFVQYVDELCCKKAVFHNWNCKATVHQNVSVAVKSGYNIQEILSFRKLDCSLLQIEHVDQTAKLRSADSLKELLQQSSDAVKSISYAAALLKLESMPEDIKPEDEPVAEHKVDDEHLVLNCNTLQALNSFDSLDDVPIEELPSNMTKFVSDPLQLSVVISKLMINMVKLLCMPQLNEQADTGSHADIFTDSAVNLANVGSSHAVKSSIMRTSEQQEQDQLDDLVLKQNLVLTNPSKLRKIKQMPSYQQYKQLIVVLRHCKVELMKSDTAKLTFWLNIRNSLFIHSLIEFGMPADEAQKHTFLFRKPVYVIAERMYNVHTIVYSVLKSKQQGFLKTDGSSALAQVTKIVVENEQEKQVKSHDFNNSVVDSKLTYDLSVSQPLFQVQFGMVNTYRDCSGDLVTYEAETVFQQLHQQAQRFIEYNVKVIADSKSLLRLKANKLKVEVPSLLKSVGSTSSLHEAEKYLVLAFPDSRVAKRLKTDKLVQIDGPVPAKLTTDESIQEKLSKVKIDTQKLTIAVAAPSQKFELRIPFQ